MGDIKQFSVKCSKFLDFSRLLVGEKIQSYEIWGSNVKWKMMVESTHLKTKVRQTLIAQRIHETIPCAHKFHSIYDIVGIPLSYVNKIHYIKFIFIVRKYCRILSFVWASSYSYSSRLHSRTICIENSRSTIYPVYTFLLHFYVPCGKTSLLVDVTWNFVSSSYSFPHHYVHNK